MQPLLTPRTTAYHAIGVGGERDKFDKMRTGERIMKKVMAKARLRRTRKGTLRGHNKSKVLVEAEARFRANAQIGKGGFTPLKTGISADDFDSDGHPIRLRKAGCGWQGRQDGSLGRSESEPPASADLLSPRTTERTRSVAASVPHAPLPTYKHTHTHRETRTHIPPLQTDMVTPPPLHSTTATPLPHVANGTRRLGGPS